MRRRIGRSCERQCPTSRMRSDVEYSKQTVHYRCYHLASRRAPTPAGVDRPADEVLGLIKPASPGAKDHWQGVQLTSKRALQITIVHARRL
jgi:hypothetical protein